MKQLTHVAARFLNAPLAIHPPKLEVIIKALGPRLGIDAQLIPRSEVPAVLADAYDSAADDAPDYRVIDGVAVIAIQGTLLKKESWMDAYSGCTSYAGLRSQIEAAVNDARVQSILLDVDSPGGETNGCFELADYIYSVRGLKPIYAVANDIALSAAYALASSADKIFVTRTAAVGSIGIYALHTDESGWDANIGMKYTYVHAGAKKVDGNPHEPLSPSAEADIQAEVDRQWGIFIDAVSRNRGVKPKEIKALEAGLLWADGAIPLLADVAGTLDDALNALRSLSGLGGSNLNAVATAAIPIKGETQMANVKVTAEETKKLVAAGTIRSCKACGKQAANGDKFCSACGVALDPEEEPAPETKPEEEPAPETKPEEEPEESKKSAAVVPAIQGVSVSVQDVRSKGDIQAISALCNIAGVSARIGEFLASNKTVAEVSEIITTARAKESESHMITSQVNTNRGAARMRDLEAEAVTYARQNHITKEKAIAQALEANPEIYEAYRAQHNAQGIVRQLQDAGYLGQ